MDDRLNKRELRMFFFGAISFVSCFIKAEPSWICASRQRRAPHGLH